MIIKCLKINFKDEKSHPTIFCLTNFEQLYEEISLSAEISADQALKDC
jgi:hypothetical protein